MCSSAWCVLFISLDDILLIYTANKLLISIHYYNGNLVQRYGGPATLIKQYYFIYSGHFIAPPPHFYVLADRTGTQVYCTHHAHRHAHEPHPHQTRTHRTHISLCVPRTTRTRTLVTRTFPVARNGSRNGSRCRRRRCHISVPVPRLRAVPD